ncbi:nuclear transport factor 2 family protein [Mycobacterium celatum]|uniref:Transporter n=1 Tax=Mycobacterium celatum TaxID=28045 RepID=A0A1X1RVM5_MYCCE|nr:ketosteroid isomerase family protein [Mycobacterium celatum]ORV18535.1 transporter [Mycobacterium celatum]PIB80832.1 transporter [Mycobacterium celatum]
MDQTQSDLLATVEDSPRAAAAHDRAGWVCLFTDDGRVEDPVGSRPHVGPVQIGRFYDTFIGPRGITFHRDLDIVQGSAVIRDLELEVAMGRAVTMHIPAVLRYDLREVDGTWKIAALRAYWELPSMMGQFLRNGLTAAPAGLQLSQALLGNQGLRGTVGFATGFRRVGSRHKRLVDGFLSAVASGDKFAALRALSPTATMTFGDDEDVDVTDMIERLGGAGCTKLIGAGPTVAASITARQGRGVLFADMAARGAVIQRVRYFAASSTNDAVDSNR